MTRRGSTANEQSEHEALDWYLANQSREQIDDETVRSWGDWWDKPENRAGYDAVLQLEQQAAALSRPTRATDEELQKDLKEMGPRPTARAALQIRVGRFPARARLFFLQRHRIAIGATCAAILACVGGVSALLRLWPADPGRTYATAPGEQGEFTLEDGSSMTLGGNTSVTVRFTNSGRMLVLSHGEGMFRVHHDTDRPFGVCAASGCITAVGTVFDVRLYSNHVRVWVQQGAVDVAPRARTLANDRTVPRPTDWKPIRLLHGQEVSYDVKNGASSPKVADPRNAGAWTHGSLVYFSRPLGEVIEDVQRYFPRGIALDPAVATLLYSGSVAQQHIDQWIDGLAQVFPVEVTDCRISLAESIRNETAEGRSLCLSQPDQILVRSRGTTR
jgi:transmembrane sensor